MKFCYQNSILVFLYILGVHRYVAGQSTSIAPFSSTELNGGYICRCWLPTSDDPLNPSSSVSDIEEPTMSVSASVEPTSSVSVIGEPTRSVSASLEPTNGVSISEELTISVSASVEPTSRVSVSIEATSRVSDTEEPTSIVSASEEPISSVSASEEPISSTYTIEEPISSTSAIEEPIISTSPSEEPISSISASEEPISSTYAIEEPISSTSAVEESISSTSPSEEPISSISANEEPISSVSASEEPISSTYAIEEPISSTSAIEEPISSTSPSEEPIGSISASIEPTSIVSANEEPISSVSASEEPISSISASEEPISSTSANEEPSSSASASEDPISSASASEEPIGSTSASEEPIGSTSVQRSSSMSSILPSPMPSPLAAPSITNITSMITAFRVEWEFAQCTLPSFEIIFYRPSDGIRPAVSGTTLKTSQTSATVRDLSPSTQYVVSIRGYCDDMTTDYSDSARVITLPQPSFDNSRVTVERLAEGTGEITLRNGMTVAVDDSLKDSNSYFGEIYGHFFLLDVSFFNSRRLLPFGTEYGDTVYTFSYYRYYYSSRYYGIQHRLSDPLPFFGKDFSLLYLNYFGFVSVGKPYNNPWNRLPFPLTGNVPIVAVMWWWYYSSIYLHEYNIGNGQGYDDAVITLVQNRLQRYHGVTLDFKPDKVVSITWSLDYVYIGYTAQLLLVSDGIKTYAIISYDDNNWNFPYWYSRYSWYRRSGPVIGYSGGDGINFKTLDVEYWNLDKIQGNTGVVGVWMFRMFNTVSNKEVEAQERCKLWYENNKHFGPVDFVAESSLNACPCTMAQAERNRRIGWSWGFRYGSRERCTVLWWPRRNNWRWWRTEPIGSKECCYDESGNLIVGSKLGGTSKKYHFYYESALHISQDYTPYLDCCVLTSKTKFCNYYYKLRVSDDCSLYDERTARFWGDPHFNTLDGLGYTFNGKGEFWLVQTTDSSISIQVRLTPTENRAATFISAAAIQFSSNVSANAYIGNNAPVVEIGGVAFGVEDVRNSTHVGMNGTVYDIDLMAGPDSINQLQNVSFILDAVNNTGISISPSDGSLSVTVRVQRGSLMNVLSVSTDLNAAAVRDKTRGLLGVINDDTTDDFTLPNGTIVDINSTEEEIYYQFGLNWRVGREEDSLFVYRGSDTYSSINNDTGFTPQFGVDLDSIPPNVSMLCGDNTQCLYDYVQTGDVGLAESTASEEMELQNTRNSLVAPPAINGSAVLRVVAGLDYTTNFTSRGELILQSPYPQNLSLTDGVLVWSTPPHWVPPEQIQIISTLNVSGNNITNSLTVFVALCGCMNGGECIEVATPNFGDGSYYQEECMCHPAYEGVLCENDTNGCRENPCQDPSFCEDVPAPGVGFNCTGCLSGYQLNGATCEDVDECSQDGSCQLHSMCENSPGSFVCVCEEGYSLNDQDCVDIDECTEGIADCQQVCVNNDGSYACQCFTGFTQDPFSGNCSATHPCGVDCGEGQCVTEDGTNKCVCPNGMQYDGTSCSNCPSDRFGFNCSMTCNCMNGGECDRVRGCVCTEGWTGGNCTTKLNNYSPEFRSDEDTMVTISDRDDVGTLVTTLVATDGDSDSSVGYSLQEFQPQSSSMYEDGRPFFSLNSDSGEVRIRRQPDDNGPYLLTVVATDNATEPRQSSPFFLVISVRSNFDKVITLQIMEDATIGTDIDGLRCSENTLNITVLSDPDQVEDVVFSIIENGSVVLLNKIDYESKQVYSLDIECLETSGSRQSASARIIVLDVNDNSPQLSLFDTHSSSDLNVIENNLIGESIGRLNFSDADSGNNGNVSFVLDPSDVPVMVNSNGEIVMTASVNYEEGTKSYSFTVTAVDGGIPSRSSTPLSFTLSITDEDDPPVFSGPGYVAHMPDHADILPSHLLTVSVGDDDTNSIHLSVDIPWVSASYSPTLQEISLSRYPTELSVNIGSIEYFQDADISPYLDGNQEPFSQESGLPAYLMGTLTATSNEITAVPLYIVVFPRNALIKVSITSGETPSTFKTTANTMATVFTESLNQHTISSSSEYKFEIFSLERNANKIDMYGYFHNSSEAGPLTDRNLPHNYHFLTQTVTKNILVDDYTQSQLTAALGSSIEYSVEGVTRPSDEPTRPSDEFILSTGIIIGIAAGGFVALLVFFLTGIALGCCLRRRHKAKVSIAHTDEVDTMMLWESPL